MIKRTIKPAAGKSHITAAAARAAARVVYRDRATGKFVVAKRDMSLRRNRKTAPGVAAASASKKR